jgi:C4-dicarboxylate-specific signal transduction histidine kinase
VTLVEEVAERVARAVERRGAEEDARFEAEEEARQQAEEEAREQSERLAHAGRMSLMGEMATGIAHEVNQPLTAISTYAQACRRMVEAGMMDDQELLEVVERISREALRAGSIIHRLRNLVRKRASERELCDINDVIRDLVSLAEIDARLHDVELRLDLGEGLPRVRVDAVQIQQVVLNLIRNALEASQAATGDGQNIDLGSSLTGPEIEIRVVDHGAGLTPGIGNEVFEPFYTTKRAGMGMGLSISRSIIDAHDGRLWFTRNQDGGTTFHVSIPVATGEV